jgi:hypothetical protein
MPLMTICIARWIGTLGGEGGEGGNWGGGDMGSYKSYRCAARDRKNLLTS